jgi:glycogen(starch) synthase
METKIFEISWEVGNKVGGIYTVLASKAKYAKFSYGKNYYVIGPYLGPKSEAEFRILSWPKEFEVVKQNLEARGFKIYYGEWEIDGLPQGFLIDFRKTLETVNEIKYELWDRFRVDSLRSGDDFNQPVAWSRAVAEFIKELINNFPECKKCIFHCHEWLSGSVILFLKDYNLPTIFTTHATVLGRTLAENGINFYEFIQDIKEDQEAYNYGVEAKHLLEKAVAQHTAFMTTISNITAEEVRYFLKREVDFLLPNGFNLEKFPTFEEISSSHRKNKQAILEFLLFFFSPYFKTCQTKNAFLIFTSGRKEIKNKGFDITIKALGKVNDIMKQNGIIRPVFFFIFVPSQVIDVDHEILENLNSYRSLEDLLSELSGEILTKLLHILIHEEKLSLENLFEESEILQITSTVKKLKRNKPAPLSTHILPPNDEILKLCQSSGLNNKEDDAVKVIIYPIYLSQLDGFLNLSYYDAINGFHLGIFPSFYEPWGYTPLETLASGVMAITSDLSGFGCYVHNKNLLSDVNPGLWILKRRNLKDEEVVDNLSKLLIDIIMMPRKDRIQNKYEARKLASYFDWKEMFGNYLTLYDLVKKKYAS